MKQINKDNEEVESVSELSGEDDEFLSDEDLKTEEKYHTKEETHRELMYFTRHKSIH